MQHSRCTIRPSPESFRRSLLPSCDRDFSIRDLAVFVTRENHRCDSHNRYGPPLRTALRKRSIHGSLLPDRRRFSYHQYFCMYGAMGTWPPAPGYPVGSIILDWQGLPSLTSTGTATRLGEQPLPPASMRSLAALLVLYL